MKKEQADRIVGAVQKMLNDNYYCVVDVLKDAKVSHRKITEALRTALEAVELTSEREVLEGFRKWQTENWDIPLERYSIDRYLNEKGETK